MRLTKSKLSKSCGAVLTLKKSQFRMFGMNRGTNKPTDKVWRNLKEKKFDLNILFIYIVRIRLFKIGERFKNSQISKISLIILRITNISIGLFLLLAWVTYSGSIRGCRNNKFLIRSISYLRILYDLTSSFFAPQKIIYTRKKCIDIFHKCSFLKYPVF